MVQREELATFSNQLNSIKKVTNWLHKWWINWYRCRISWVYEEYNRRTSFFIRITFTWDGFELFTCYCYTVNIISSVTLSIKLVQGIHIINLTHRIYLTSTGEKGYNSFKVRWYISGIAGVLLVVDVAGSIPTPAMVELLWLKISYNIR